MCDAGDLQGLAAYILHSARMLNAMHNSFCVCDVPYRAPTMLILAYPQLSVDTS